MPTPTKITWLHNPQQLATDALALYGLQARRLTAMSASYNTVYRVQTADGDFALRLHRLDDRQPAPDMGKNYITSELLWLQALAHDTNLSVPQPLANLQGELVTLVQDEGGRLLPCSVLHWMEGRFYNQGLRCSYLERVGEMTARLHNYSESGQFVPPPDFERDRADGLDGPKRMFEFHPMQTDVREPATYWGELLAKYDAATGTMVAAAIEQVWANLNEFGPGSDRFGLIHADIHQWNYLFWRGEIKLLDFNNVGYAHYLFDLAVTLDNLLDRADYATLKAALLKGYQRERTLPANCQRYLRSLIALRNLTHLWPLTLSPTSAEVQRFWPELEKGLARLRPYVAGDDNW